MSSASPHAQTADGVLQRQVDQLDLGGPSTSTLDQPSREAKGGEGTLINGARDTGGEGEAEHGSLMTVEGLQAELERVKDERDSFEGQYHGLLSKLGQMRSTLGDRLRQDAEELDRREQQIEQLTTKIEELSGTIQTLEAELVTSHEEVERLSKELDSVRSTMQQQESNSSATKGSELRLRELQEMAERYRIEAESWEGACMEERAYRDEVDLQVREARRERDEAVAREREQSSAALRERETARGLQQVLEEFQAAQESELRRAVGDSEEKLTRLSTLLGEHELRTQKAEETATHYREAAERCQQIEKESKEKNVLIGKLRHEAVILNEHLTESLRRLRANTSDSNVDGKLITNLLIQFLNTPRSDTKRFEMLNLIASVLNWTAEDRERAGLQRNNDKERKSIGVSAKRDSRKGQPTTPGGGSTTNEESFSNLFVEFLLSEAEKAKQPPTNASASASPTATPSSPATPKQAGRPSFNLGSLANLNRTSSDDARGGLRSPQANVQNGKPDLPQTVRSP